MTVTIELPESVARELDSRNISTQQVRAFVIQTIEAWLRLQPTGAANGGQEQSPSRFAESALPFIEKLVYENRILFERLANL